MSTQEVFVEQFAKLLHHYRDALSSSQEPLNEGLASWDAVSPDERDQMVAAARLAILELETNQHAENRSRRYFAKPGQAEWGC